MSTEPHSIDPALITWDEVIPGGAYWSRIIKRGTTLRLVAPEGSRGVAFLCYNADNTIERYNAADTAKIQFNAFLKKGMLLYSDMGRVLFSITEDTCGLHDTLGGCSNLATNSKYGEGDYKNSRDNFLLALIKRNLGKKDIMPNLNLFTRIAVDPNGNLSWAEKTAQPGDFIDLRAEMNVLAVLSNCPHPLDPSPTYEAKPIRAIVWNSPASTADDPLRTSNPEAVRGFQNTDAYLGQLV
ncbi:urea carboxylase-associated family protein [Leptolyngbya sp. FACHB-321]|uniref:urea amidolyase associated protein UAAP1 n=1 Tax=Leptolyngbya sp. FACHB-321 TaxID=2692807 RepID=UPI001687262B|nr:urea amidolyase associated protein UAAP1 [Leptolyngbya sp. FACHB-321]MBD2036562.1 urea carboxylase-associated family protein [Leptolyngbya sp. FACHB-321]